MKYKRQFIIAGFVFALAGVALYQNCQGTQTRSVDTDFTQSTVSTWETDVSCALSSGSTSAVVASSWALYQSLKAQPDSNVQQMDAPNSENGTVATEAPQLEFSALRDDGGGTPQSFYAFFAVGSNGTGALFIGLIDSSTTSANPTPTPTTTLTTANVQKKIKTIFQKNSVVKNDATTSSSATCASSNPLNLTAAIAAYNDGTQGLELASFDDSGFEMQMTLENGNTIYVTSDDVDGDGGLDDSALLQIFDSDGNYYGGVQVSSPSDQ